MTLKYFSNKTSTGIIRCGRGQFEMIVAAMSLCNWVERERVVFNCVHVSGTIKKCEEFGVRRSRELMRRIEGHKGKSLTI